MDVRGIARRVAARVLLAQDYFSVGDEILFGKYKNKKGKILKFFTDERGVPMVEIEPVPKGRKQNKTMGMFNLWHLPERRGLPSKKTACIIVGKDFDGHLCLLKNRDRSYDAELQIMHMEFAGVEMTFVLDLETGYLEGVNEHGIGVVNTTLMVLHDENEGHSGKTTGKRTLKSKDGPKIFHALLQDNLEDAVETLVSFNGGIRGHTFVADGKSLISIECTRKNPARVHRLDPARVNTRTNHGVSYPEAGYTKGEDYVSSIVRRWEAQKRIQDVKRPEAVAPALVALIDDADSPFNPVRVTDKMRTTSQLLIDTSTPSLYLYLVPGHATIKKTINLLPGGRRPKIPVRVFRYREKMEDREFEDSDGDEAKDEVPDAEGILQEDRLFARRVLARYKDKKTVKTKDGDERVVYEYGPRQVINRNRAKAERVEKLRKTMADLRTKVRRDLEAKDEKRRAVALAVALMDETYERPGNEGSAGEGHFGVTTWQRRHVRFRKGKATISYVGKSGIEHKKTVETPAVVKALRAACEGKGQDACLVDVESKDVNEYLRPFKITGKDIRGFHANREMKERLRKIRREGPDLPRPRKDRDKVLSDEFKRALGETAEAVGHTESTLRSQYLVPGLEDDYMKDGTVSDSLVKSGAADVVTDTATVYAIAPEALHDMIGRGEWEEQADKMWGDDPATDDTWNDMSRIVREMGGAVFETGADGGFDVEVVGRRDDQGVRAPLLSPVREQGALPPYGLHRKAARSMRAAAERGTATERRILANAVLAPVLVVRDRRWWIDAAPTLYRIAREHERPRPVVDGLRFDPEMFAMLWYEDGDGHRIRSEDEHDTWEVPKGAETQHSMFPNVLRHGILLLNDDGTSTSVATGESSFPSDLVTEMVRSGDWDVADAIMVAGQACERCLNVLLHRYGLDDGYPFASDAYWRAGTRCPMCEHLVGDPREDEARGRAMSQARDVQATKTPAELEDERVEDMLRPEPKKKPPRYDLRNNRTLEEDDEDLEGMGGGDRGDRDLSLKWNKVARRVAFRWLAVPEAPRPLRVAHLHVAREFPSDFQEDIAHRQFTHPETRNQVGFGSLPQEEQTRIYERWKGRAEEDPEPDEEREAPEEERTREDVEKNLDRARDRVDELEEKVDKAKAQIRESRDAVKGLKKLLEKASETARAQLETKIKEETTNLRRAEDDLEDLGGELKEAKKEVEDLKRERKDPGGVEEKRRQEEAREQQERAREAISEVQESIRGLVSAESDLPNDVQAQIERAFENLDDEQVEAFSGAFRKTLGDLVKTDAASEDAANLANVVARVGDVGESDDPEEMARRIAEIAYVRNVVGNPLVVGGRPVGQTKMDEEGYSGRALDAFRQFQRLQPTLREQAAEKIREEMRGLDAESDRAQELEAVLTGINTAHIADTGRSLEGRPEPSKGAAALIRRMVENGQAATMFRPAEDFFAEDSRRAMEGALSAMSDEEVADFVVGDDRDHPFAQLREHLAEKGASEYKQLVKDFLIQDFMSDIWGDRAVRDYMESAGFADAGDPEVRAKLMADTRYATDPEEEMAALGRIEKARASGEEPDSADEEMVREFLDPDTGKGLRGKLRGLMDALRAKFKKHVVTPATAVLNHFLETGEAAALRQETVPHPDEGTEPSTGRAEREDEEHGPGDVWRTEQGNWRAKNPDGVPKTFDSQDTAQQFARPEAALGEAEGFSAEFGVPTEERGPSRFAAGLANAWAARIRHVHPDDPARPRIVLEAA